MKLFIVNYHNCLELSHFETFFYKNIKNGRIFVCPETLNSYSQFDTIYRWLIEEINRNPFSISSKSKGLVLFCIPRDLTKDLTCNDIDITAKIFIREKISSELDNLFSYACIYVDRTGGAVDQDPKYQAIRQACESFYSDNPNIHLLSKQRGDIQTIDELKQIISAVPDETVRSFFDGVLKRVQGSIEDPDGDGSVILQAFFQNCAGALQNIKELHVAYPGSDISQKTITLLKLISYICKFAEQPDSNDFDEARNTFLNLGEFQGYSPDYDTLRKTIATYKKRLSDWLNEINRAPTTQEESITPLSFTPSNDAQLFQTELDGLVSDNYAETLLHPSLDELDEFDASEQVFSRLDNTLKDVDKKLGALCEKAVNQMYTFRERNPSYLTTEASGAKYTQNEISGLAEALDAVNQYQVSDLPGYSAELKLRQELDIINERIRYVGRRVKAAKPKLFFLTLGFALLSVLGFYFFAQHSVFAAENTWWVFGGYLVVCGTAFLLSYVFLRHYYKRRAFNYLKECQEKIDSFLKNYKKRAEEFENNINHAMDYACKQDSLFKKADQQHTFTWRNERFQWHRAKTQSILLNLRHFDAFLQGTAPVNEAGGPTSPSEDNTYLHDAVHSDFYQMQIFGQQP